MLPDLKIRSNREKSSSSYLFRSSRFPSLTRPAGEVVGQFHTVTLLAFRGIDGLRLPADSLCRCPAVCPESVDVFDQLAEETSTETIYVNCWQYDTRSSLLTELLIEMAIWCLGRSPGG